MNNENLIMLHTWEGENIILPVLIFCAFAFLSSLFSWIFLYVSVSQIK